MSETNGTHAPIQEEPAIPLEGFDGSWANRHAAALVEAVDAYAKAQKGLRGDALELERWKIFGQVTRVERAIAGELMFLLRKANEHAGPQLRALLTEIIGDVVTGLLDEFRNELAEMADAVARLERRRPA